MLNIKCRNTMSIDEIDQALSKAYVECNKLNEKSYKSMLRQQRKLDAAYNRASKKVDKLIKKLDDLYGDEISTEEVETMINA